MKHLTITAIMLVIGLLTISVASAEWKHSNPQDLSVEWARLGQILVNVQDATIDVSFTEGKIKYFMDGDTKKCVWVPMGASHKTFKDDPATNTYDFSRMLQWVAGNIGPGFTQKAEGLMATELNDLPVELLDIDPFCAAYTTNGIQYVSPQ